MINALMDRSKNKDQHRLSLRFMNSKGNLAAFTLLSGYLLLSFTAPWILPHLPDTTSAAQFAPPSVDHFFGTNLHGMDMFARTLAGAKVSFLVGAVGSVVSLVIGVSWGAIAGYLGHGWDAALMRIVDILYALPSIIFVIVMITTFDAMVTPRLATFFGNDAPAVGRLLFLFVGLGAVSWLNMARIVRGQVLSLKNHRFIEASRAMGASHRWILRHHILPNVTNIVIVYLTLTIPSVVLYESFLSYLGLGVQPPHASLGSLLAEGASQINAIQSHWWMVVFPALALAIMLLTLNFLGDGLKKALAAAEEVRY